MTYLGSYLTLKGRGEMTRLAQAVRVSLPTMSMWASGKRQIPMIRAFAIEEATGGKLKFGKLRPDLNNFITSRAGRLR